MPVIVEKFNSRTWRFSQGTSPAELFQAASRELAADIYQKYIAGVDISKDNLSRFTLTIYFNPVPEP